MHLKKTSVLIYLLNPKISTSMLSFGWIGSVPLQGPLPSVSSSLPYIFAPCACASSVATPTTNSRSISSTSTLAPRKDFPILFRKLEEDQDLIYLDSAATTQKPQVVIDALRKYYEQDNANVHRGAHSLSARATEGFERARELLQKLINARLRSEVIFTRNATEGVNLVAQTWGAQNLRMGDEIAVSVMEHHANLVPWEMIAKTTGAKVTSVGLSADGIYNMEHLQSILSGGKVKIVSCSQISNVLGCLNPVEDIVRIAHDAGAMVLVDACQSLARMPVDVQAIDCDWLVGSGHKMMGPTGIGFLYGKEAILNAMPPYMGGGEMIADVFLDHSTYADLPHKFEAGTPAIGEAIGLGAAVEYMFGIGLDAIHQYDLDLGQYLYQGLSQLDRVTVYGPRHERVGLSTFNVERLHASDLATMMDLEGIAVRSGHHCAEPLHRYLRVDASLRASTYIYNSKEEIDAFLKVLQDSIAMLDANVRYS